jgi:hypothetical protein
LHLRPRRPERQRGWHPGGDGAGLSRIAQLDQRTNVCTRRKRTCGPQAGSLDLTQSCRRGAADCASQHVSNDLCGQQAATLVSTTAMLGTALHSITSSARSSSPVGNSIPSAFAVLRLRVSSILVACRGGDRFRTGRGRVTGPHSGSSGGGTASTTPRATARHWRACCRGSRGRACAASIPRPMM